MRFSELMRVVGGRGVRIEEVRAGGDPEMCGVCEDSRKVTEGDLFVARGGTKRDGVEFIGDAIGRGAVGVVVQEGAGIAIEGEGGREGVAFARVGNVNLALALLRMRWRGGRRRG